RISEQKAIRHVTLKIYPCQVSAEGERRHIGAERPSEAGDAVEDRHACQTEAQKERTVSDAGDAVGVVTLVRLRQELNASSPMLVTLSGIATLARPCHGKNAASPMLVTLLGMVTLVRLMQ